MVKTGDYVIYKPKKEIGRVAKVCKDGCFICYSTGCTSAFTSWEYLRRANDLEISKADPDIGFNRFKDKCDKYVESICYGYCPNKP